MLGILDRYLVRSLVYSYMVVGVALMGLTMMLDAFLRIKDFMEAAHAPAAPGFGVMSVMVQYYAVRLPVFYQRISPAVMLTAAMFCMAQFNKNNELMPIRASGVSLYRTLVPVFLIGVAVTGLIFVNQEIVIPALVPQLRTTESILDAGETSVLKRLYLNDDRENNWDVARYNKGEERVEGVLLTARYGDTLVNRVHVRAESAKWKRTAGDGVPRWHLSNGIQIRYQPTGERLTADAGNYDPQFGIDGYVVLRPDDRVDDPFRIVSNFTPRDMIPADVGLAYQSSAYLRRVLAASPGRRDVAMVLHNRLAFPLANIVLLLLGLPFVLGTEAKSTFGGLIVCIVICAAFYGTHALCTELGKETLSPAAAAWLPIAVFGPLGIFLFDWVRT
jgi:lipopolysaccharide export system permease protein